MRNPHLLPPRSLFRLHYSAWRVGNTVVAAVGAFDDRAHDRTPVGVCLHFLATDIVLTLTRDDLGIRADTQHRHSEAGQRATRPTGVVAGMRADLAGDRSLGARRTEPSNHRRFKERGSE